jgi:undecaprenyl diphosphate synthase
MEKSVPRAHSTSLSPPAAAEFEVPREKRPRHIAVIMDGNGRWAQQRGLPRIEGHRHGVAALRATVEECARLEIQQLTLFCLSSENWKRPPAELRFLMQLLAQYMVEERAAIVKQGIRLSVIGRREAMPADALREIDKTIDLTRHNSGLSLCLAINYGARAELADAVQSIAREVEAGRLRADQVNEGTIAAHLYTAGAPDPDLLIRTAGEMRLSNFLLWQISYAEVWVTPTYWPDFDASHLRQAIRDFARRDRRFGGLPPKEKG